MCFQTSDNLVALERLGILSVSNAELAIFEIKQTVPIKEKRIAGSLSGGFSRCT